MMQIFKHAFSHTILFFCCFAVLLFTTCVPQNMNDKVYLSRVFEYVYAPGQHASLALPADTAFIIGDPALQTNWMYLGGFGGYVVAGFPRNIPNGEGADIGVFALPGAGPEPAVVYVMQDENGDGLPNETWYELKGSLLAETDRNYTLTYYKPSQNEAHIKWKDNRGNSGVLVPGHGSNWSSGWWWSGNVVDSITFTGTRLPDVYTKSVVGGVDFWTVPAASIAWGYAENKHGTDFNPETGTNDLDISNAIDESGNSVNIAHIRFVKLQTAVFQQAGMINEISAEIRGVCGR